MLYITALTLAITPSYIHRRNIKPKEKRFFLSAKYKNISFLCYSPRLCICVEWAVESDTMIYVHTVHFAAKLYTCKYHVPLHVFDKMKIACTKDRYAYILNYTKVYSKEKNSVYWLWYAIVHFCIRLVLNLPVAAQVTTSHVMIFIYFSSSISYSYLVVLRFYTIIFRLFRLCGKRRENVLNGTRGDENKCQMAGLGSTRKQADCDGRAYMHYAFIKTYAFVCRLCAHCTRVRMVWLRK